MDSLINTPLATLPLELLRKITSYLDLQDYVNLRASCMRLCMSLKSDEVCRAYVKDCMNFTFEADHARNDLIDYSTAIQRTYLTRTRFQLANPYSVIVLGHDHGWFYGEGLLVYSLGDLIRILDVYNAAVTEDIIDLRSLLNEEAERWHPHTQGIMELLSRGLDLDIVRMDYKEGVLLISIKEFDPTSRYLVVINIRKDIPLQERLILIRRYYSTCEAITDGHYMIVFDESKYRGAIELYDLEDKQQGMQKRSRPSFIHPDTADRQIYDGWFYVLIGNLEGYNYCYRFPLKQSRPVTMYFAAGIEPLPEQLQFVRLKRLQPRSHQNCGIDSYDAWSSHMKLCRDEYSGQLMIVEGWYHGGDDAPNPEYTFQPLQIPEPNSAIDDAMPDRDVYFNYDVQTLNPADLPRAEKDCECPKDPGWRLKARSYVPRASTFFDVYLGSGANADSRKQFEFHLAVVSRHCASPSESESGQLDKVSSKKLCGVSPDDNNERQSVGVRRFPPNGAPNALTDLLCPSGKLKRDKISLHDQRSIVYSTKRLHRRLNDTADQLVLINFDPWIRFHGLEPMVLRPLSTQLTSKEYENELARAKKDQIYLSEEEYETKAKKRAAKRAKIDEMNKAEKEGKVWEPRSPWFWNEPAMYLDIGQGFQFS